MPTESSRDVPGVTRARPHKLVPSSRRPEAERCGGSGAVPDRGELGRALATWAAFDDDPLLLVTGYDDRVRIRWTNRACEHAFGYTADELDDEPLSRLLRSPFAVGGDEDDPDTRLLVDERRTVRRSVRMQRRDGSPLRMALSSVPCDLGDRRGWVVRLVQEADVARVADDLRASHERFQALADCAPIAIFSSEAGLRLGYVNDKFSDLHGEQRERLLGTEWLSFVHQEDLGRAIAAMQGALMGLPAELPLRLVTGEARERHVQARIVPVRTSQRDAGFVGTLEDVTERRAWEERLEYHATHDALTRLPNRRQLNEALAQHVSSVPRPNIALVFLDLDEFKIVNDSLGHDAGDHLLVEVATRLRNAVREHDVVSRFGGDEFAILCFDVDDEAEAERIGQRLLAAVTGPVLLGINEFTVSASLGIVLLAPEHLSPEDLVRDADIAMYQAKAAGKNCLALFDERARSEAQQRLGLVADLRRAIESEALTVMYQPVIDLAGGASAGLAGLCSVEALVRWTHPVLGRIPPQDFVGLAEQNGLVVQLGGQVLRAACRQMVTWQSELGELAPRSISVNVSAIQLRHPGLVDQVAAILEETGLPGSRLCLELTETVVMHDAASAAETFSALRALGVRIAIDDFGTGYSSLALLRHLPVDQLKIDSSLLDELRTAKADPVVAAVIALAQGLALEVVAEGVETIEQATELARLGCGCAQGYWFSVPLTPTELTAELLKHRNRQEDSA